MDNIELIEKKEYNPYCLVCEGCGEEGCCSPLNCDQHIDGKYCKAYLRDLKFSYRNLKDFISILYQYEDKNKEILEIFDQIWEKNYEFYYTLNQ